MLRVDTLGGRLAALAILALLAGAGLWTYGWLVGSPSGGPRFELADTSSPRLEAQWPAGGDRPVELRVDSSHGPVRKLEGRRIALTPFADEANFEWRLHASDGGWAAVGRGSLAGGDLRALWRFQDGDPQATLEMSLSDVPLSTLLERDLRGTVRLPDGEMRASDPSMGLADRSALDLPHRLDPWTPTWLAWRGEQARLGIVGWTGDGVELARSEEGFEITFDLWRREDHPGLEACSNDGESSPTLDLTATATYQFGKTPAILRGRYPNGSMAALAPIFDLPSAHPDTTLHEGGAAGPDDWAARTRTLAFGHSETDDPRYGNGGLLGHGLGGTVVVPGDWYDHSAVESLRDELDERALEVAARGDSPKEASGLRSHLGGTPACASLLGDGESTPPAVVVSETVPFRSKLTSAIHSDAGSAAPRLSPPSAPIAAGARPFRLDGTRPQFLEEVLSEQNLDRLERERGLGTFATPLLGTRNPLVAAAKEALLSPERHGAWTLASAFATALVDLEITADSRPLVVRSLADLVDYWREARRTRLHWTHEGTLLVRSASDAPIRGFTLVADGVELSSSALSLEPDGDPTVRRFDHETGPGRPSPQTSITWDLAPETTYRLDFGDRTSALFEATPVEWHLERE